MTTLGSSVQTIGNLLHTHDLYDHLRAVPPAIAPHADPLNFCSPRIAGGVGGGPGHLEIRQLAELTERPMALKPSTKSACAAMRTVMPASTIILCPVVCRLSSLAR